MIERPYPLPLSVEGMTVGGGFVTFEVCGLSLRLGMPEELRARLETAVGKLWTGRRIQPVVLDLDRSGLSMTVPVQHRFFVRFSTVEQLRNLQEQVWKREGAAEELAHAG